MTVDSKARLVVNNITNDNNNLITKFAQPSPGISKRPLIVSTNAVIMESSWLNRKTDKRKEAIDHQVKKRQATKHTRKDAPLSPSKIVYQHTFRHI